jgi:putative redox protein
MVEAQPLATAYRTEVVAGENGLIADTRKDGRGGSAGMRPHELLEAALATCMTITARMALEEVGAQGTAVIARVWLERAAAASTFHYELELGGALSGEQRCRVLARVRQCPVRRTLTQAPDFAEHV